MHKNHTDLGVKCKCQLLIIAILEYIGILNCYPVNQLRMVKTKSDDNEVLFFKNS